MAFLCTEGFVHPAYSAVNTMQKKNAENSENFHICVCMVGAF